MTISWKTGLAVLLFGLSVSSAQAADITCMPNDERVATLGSATLCETENDLVINSSDDLNDVLGTNYNWIDEGNLTTGSSNDLLTIVLTLGDWGISPIAGTWAIDPSFWSIYGIAAITMHAGQGNGNPDAFAWLITPGATSGTFSYEDLDGKGGGLSGFRLWGTEQPQTTTTTGNPTTTDVPTTTTDTPTTTAVPEPNAGVLSAIGLLALVAVRQWSRKSNAEKAR